MDVCVVCCRVKTKGKAKKLEQRNKDKVQRKKFPANARNFTPLQIFQNSPEAHLAPH
jgi:hypothetical protein